MKRVPSRAISAQIGISYQALTAVSKVEVGERVVFSIVPDMLLGLGKLLFVQFFVIEISRKATRNIMHYNYYGR